MFYVERAIGDQKVSEQAREQASKMERRELSATLSENLLSSGFDTLMKFRLWSEKKPSSMLNEQ